ncbi:MAG: hypothetical protein WBA12_08245, partial [Catalinimonas sp.]
RCMVKRLILCTFLLLPATLWAQADTLAPAPTDSLPTRYVEVGLSAAAYKGDLSAYARWTPLAHVALHFQRRKRLNGSLQLMVGQVAGQGLNARFQEGTATDGRTPNRDFRTALFAFNYTLHLNLIARERFRLFVAQGAGLLRYAPQDRDGNRLADRATTLAPGESYGVVALHFPSSVGLLYFLPNRWALGLSAGWLNPATDYLDNVGTYGTRDGGDQVAAYRFSVRVPLR